MPAPSDPANLEAGQTKRALLGILQAMAYDASFDAWLTRTRPKLLRLAESRLRDRGLAEDVVQETCLAVWRRHQAGAVQDLDAYASRSVWQNAIRLSSRRRPWVALEDLAAAQGLSVPPAVESALEAAELERAIARLPQVQQTVLRLRFYAGYGLRECAAALGLSINTVSSRVRYALEALRRPPAAPISTPLDSGATHEKRKPRRRPVRGR